MDSQACQDHQHKDLLSSFFPDDSIMPGQPGSDVHHHQHSQQRQAHCQDMFQFNLPSPASSQLALEMGMPTNSQQQHSSQPQPMLQSQAQIAIDMLGDLQLMPASTMDSNSSQDPNATSSSQMGGRMAYSPPLMLDQQFRLTQLQQLQQLQQQIFQQQIALISGQAPGLLNGIPSYDTQRDQSFTFNGLPTPTSSGELRPQPQSLDFISPMALNTFDGSSQSSQGHHSQHSSPILHSAPGSVMSSPTFLAMPNGGTQGSNAYSSTSYIPPGSVSAPEYIAFQTNPSQNGLPPAVDLDLDISPLTSPWLGAQSSLQAASFFQNQLQNKGQSRHNQQHSGQRSCPRASASASPSPSQGGPQYPSTPIPHTNPNINSNNKRSASPTSTETDARKKQSPAVRPTNPTAFSPYLDQQPPSRRSNRTRTRSNSSAPHLRARSQSGRQRKGSVATPIISEVPGDSPSPVDLSMPPPAPPAPPNPALMNSGTNSVPPSPAIGPLRHGTDVSQLTPVTPASIMNLDMKGKRLKIVTDTSAGGGGNTSPASARSKRSMHGSANSVTSLISPSLKPILPGPSNVSSFLPMTPASAANGNHTSTSMPLPQVRKTSHKAAEQKRRDSLKTTFDELRGLLPPIPLPSAPGTGQGGEEDTLKGASGPGTGGPSAVGPSGIVFGHTVKPLLPGALPPRGPPKAGGEGPNKGVSKLQLLICGNEYIRTLMGRVNRRDEEIERLRREVRKLRQLLGVLSAPTLVQESRPGPDAGGGNSAAGGGDGRELGTMAVEGLLEQLDLDLDLDGDLDAVEKLGGLANGMSSARSDIMDEDPDEDEN